MDKLLVEGLPGLLRGDLSSSGGSTQTVGTPTFVNGVVITSRTAMVSLRLLL